MRTRTRPTSSGITPTHSERPGLAVKGDPRHLFGVVAMCLSECKLMPVRLRSVALA